MKNDDMLSASKEEKLSELIEIEKDLIYFNKRNSYNISKADNSPPRYTDKYKKTTNMQKEDVLKKIDEDILSDELKDIIRQIKDKH